MKKSSSAFTIIELVVSISIIGMLAAITIVSYNGVQGRARDSDRRADISNITKALEQYYSDNNAYPIPAGNWYYSNNANWATFGTALAGTIDSLPTDPRNTGDPTVANTYGYAYYTASGCGKAAGQWYLIVYRFEYSTLSKFSDGACSTNEGDSYTGVSYYRSVK